jgi:hypothetical protein
LASIVSVVQTLFVADRVSRAGPVENERVANPHFDASV